MPTNEELWDAAWKEITLTTDSYPAWRRKGFPLTSHFAKAKALGEQITNAVVIISPPVGDGYGTGAYGRNAYGM